MYGSLTLERSFMLPRSNQCGVRAAYSPLVLCLYLLDVDAICTGADNLVDLTQFPDERHLTN